MECSITCLKQLSCSLARHLPKEQGVTHSVFFKDTEALFQSKLLSSNFNRQNKVSYFTISKLKILKFQKRNNYIFFKKLFNMSGFLVEQKRLKWVTQQFILSEINGCIKDAKKEHHNAKLEICYIRQTDYIIYIL